MIPPRPRASFARSLLFVFALLLAPGSAPAQEPHYPEPTGYVVDEAGLLSEETRTRLTAIAHELDEKTKVQIAVATVPSIAPLSVEEYAVKLFEKWGVGGREKDEGVLFVLARDERRVRIEVGYGLEGLLPDGRVGGILRSSVVPHLKHDDWNAGVTGAVVALATTIAEDRGVTLASLTGVPRPPPEDDDEGPPPSALMFIAMFVGLMILTSILNARKYRRRRRRGFWIGPGGFGGWGGGFGGGGFGHGGGFGGGGGGFGGFGGGSSGGGGASSGF